MNLPWKTKGIVLTAPLSAEVDDVVEFIDKYLAPNGCNLIVMQVRYRYEFKLHPECRGYDPLSREDVKKLVEVCRKKGIRLVPKMNLIGHQSGLHNTPTDGILHGHGKAIPDFRDGLLRAYPELDEQPDEKAVVYSRSLCLTNPLVKLIVFDLMDELIDAFEADAIHIGCDEVFNIGLCPECSKVSNAELFANYISALHEHLADRGVELMMWGDRFLDAEKIGFGKYESSYNGTSEAINMIPKDILICDWHYENQTEFPSVDIFADAGLKMLVCPMRVKEHAVNFIEYAAEHDRGHIEGLLMTTWFGSGELARHMLYGDTAKWQYAEQIADTIRYLFE
ncbi:MAG: glycoside hydrolase [Ruminococcaceae bacterium]|nr:glycoside hydrolase [Oscillospiraceae bacterium]